MISLTSRNGPARVSALFNVGMPVRTCREASDSTMMGDEDAWEVSPCAKP